MIDPTELRLSPVTGWGKRDLGDHGVIKPESYDERLAAARVDAVFDAAPINVSLNYLGVVLAIYFARHDLPVTTHLVFAGAMLALASARAVQIRSYRVDQDRASHVDLYARRYVWLSLTSGIVWGVYGFLAVTATRDLANLLGVGLIASSVAFGGVTNAIYPRIFLSHGLPINLCLAAGSFARHDDWGALFGGLALILIPVHILVGRAVARITLKTLRLTFENEALIEDLTLARQRADAGNRAKADFLAMMSHEIRTPLTAVLGLTEAAIEQAVDEGQRHFLSIALDNGWMLLTLLDDILDLSKLESDAITFEVRPFDPAALVQGVVSLMAGRAAEKNLALTTAIDPNMPKVLGGDGGRLRQVLLNLVNNAIKFTDQGGIAIKLDSRARDQAQVTLRVAVSDTGVGIPPEAQDKIFERFVQADFSIERRFGGSGLGLAISRRIIDAQGGRIGVISQPGSGATFWFEVDLPVVEPELVAVPSAVLAPTDRALTILVAEDNTVLQMLIRTILERAGHRVTVLEDGHVALSTASQGGFDLIVLDLHMPGLSGLEIARRLRLLDGQVPILALTAAVSAEDRQACLAAGMNEVIAKPFRPADLIAAVARYGAGQSTNVS